MKRGFKAAMLALVLGLCSSFALSACSAGSKPAPDPDAGLRRQVMHASWAKGYASVEELMADTDFAGLIEVTGVVRVENSGAHLSEGSMAMPATVFSARVLDAAAGGQTELEIYMTGERTDEEVFELADDPLMASGEKWFIFARQNDNGTHTILTGPCGRFAYDEAQQRLTQLMIAVDQETGAVNAKAKVNADEIPNGAIPPMTLAEMKDKIAEAQAK
ncbi:hypothetical protein DPQ25_06390 [Hydrogeniiclostridium mannosilyticum]|uniref:Lipoprotein n=1 Tax=Hydrogeniiclostridium mannosilyticum TaxID=2764322 RepID=A0A328UDH6_9FIRM|nr:hypothetical protein [Hydrogeniiclostridium mannosilyticum]RAQ29907.1 hypothetical protein DPQ25_06390 [Hydrogeniiclostridium mannosilyticum]